MTTPNAAPEKLLDRIRQGHRFLLTSHVNPDGDAVGSSIGLKRILRKLGKAGVVWLRDPVPEVYRVLPGSDRVHVGEEPPEGFPELFDGALVMECPSPDRTGLEKHLDKLPLLNLDHHLGNQQYGEVNWVDTAAPAVGEMVYRLGRALKVPLDPDTANTLYLTLVTDTGGFRYSNTTAATFDAAAELVREGASPETISTWLYESQPEAALRLASEVLQTLELHADGRIATAFLTREMIAKVGAKPGDSEGLIDYLRSIAGVEAAALFRQIDDGSYKVSLRSRGAVNVEKLARREGGGGHQNAAGFSTTEPREALHPKTVAALEKLVAADRSA